MKQAVLLILGVYLTVFVISMLVAALIAGLSPLLRRFSKNRP